MNAPSFLARHRKDDASFSRNRVLNFSRTIQIILCRSVKSLQLILNEWAGVLEGGVSASALSQARLKLSHTAFIELLEEVVIATMYGSGDSERFKGHRLLAIDGSSLRLPTTEETKAKFGYIENLNGHGAAISGQVEAKSSILYDVLNEIPISGELYCSCLSFTFFAQPSSTSSIS